MPPNTVYVGRPSKWGNPYWIGCNDYKTIEEVLEDYREHIKILLNYPDEYNLDELRGKDLACWCPLDKPCHVDVLLELLEKPSIPPAAARSSTQEID